MYLCLHIFWECVSIHAPWEGCDPSLETLTAKLLCFNSRTLGRVRLSFTLNLDTLDLFQFTHPGKGATI